MVTYRQASPGAGQPTRPSVPLNKMPRPAVQQPIDTLQPSETFDLGDGDTFNSYGAGAAAGGGMTGMPVSKRPSLKDGASKRPSLKDKTSRKKPFKVAKSSNAPAKTQAPSAQATAQFPQGSSAQATAQFPQASSAQATAQFPQTSSAQPASQSAQASPAQSTSARPKAAGKVAKPKVKKSHKMLIRVIAIAVALALVSALGFAGYGIWNKWLRYDDAADMQGAWLSNGTVVSIDAEYIHMPDSVDFAYTLNTKDKTISYTFGELSGGGSYTFAEDRESFTVAENEGAQVTFTKYRGEDATPRTLSAEEAAALAASMASTDGADGATDGTAASASGATDAAQSADEGASSATGADDASANTANTTQE